MKKILSLAICSMMIIACFAACKPNTLETRNVESQANPTVVTTQPAKQDPAPIDPTKATDPVENPNPDQTQTQPEDPNQNKPAVDYEHLFDFSGWEADYADAEDKDAFVEDFWYNKTIEVMTDDDMYELITSDPKAKQAFFDEFSKQMKLQMEEYVKDSGIELTDEIRAMINQTVDEHITSLGDIFDPVPEE